MFLQVWEQGTYCIVMTTKLLERGRVKCGKYWPDKGAQLQYGYFVVSCLDEVQTRDYVKRTFTVTFPQVGLLPQGDLVQWYV